MKSSLLIAASLAAIASSGFGAEVMPREFYYGPRGYRRNSGRARSTPKGGYPAGTKLARKAAKGKLGIKS